MLQCLAMGSQRPQDWDQELVRLATSQPDSSLDHIAGCLYGFYRAIDSGDSEEARQFIRVLEQEYAEAYVLIRDVLALEIAYFVARYEHKYDDAQHWYEKGKRVIKSYHYILRRVEAALYLLAGEYEEAAAKAKEGLQALPTLEHQSDRFFEERQLQEILSLATDKKSVPY